MSLIGRWFKVVDISKMRDFDILVGDILKVQDEYVAHISGHGATVVERVRGGKAEVLRVLHHQAYWCIFSEGMVSKGDLVEVQSYMQNVRDSEEYTKAVETVQKRSAAVTKSYLHAYGVESLEDRYNNWIVENIHVYELFCKFAIKAIQSGKKKISHWLIVNRLRWEVEIETKGTCHQDKDFKISNDYIAFLARDFMKDYPQYGEVFTIKQMKRV